MKITTNNIPRPIIYGFELSESEKKDFDYYSDNEFEFAIFFRYKGELYDLHEFMLTTHAVMFKDWHSYQSDTFFSGLLIKYTDDNESVIVGSYYA